MSYSSTWQLAASNGEWSWVFHKKWRCKTKQLYWISWTIRKWGKYSYKFFFIYWVRTLSVLTHYIVPTLVPTRVERFRGWDVRRVQQHPTQTKADVRRMRATILRKRLGSPPSVSVILAEDNLCTCYQPRAHYDEHPFYRLYGEWFSDWVLVAAA